MVITSSVCGNSVNSQVLVEQFKDSYGLFTPAIRGRISRLSFSSRMHGINIKYRESSNSLYA